MIDRDYIRSRREKLGISLSDAAIRAGWGYGGRTRWHDIETGRRASLELATLEAMAQALDCAPSSLLASAKK